jgi:hypothetical protein
MHIFTIDHENHVKASVVRRARHPSIGNTFANLKELSRISANWPGKRLVEIWNKLPNVKEVRKFTDRGTAIQRIWNAVQDLRPSLAPPPGTAASLSARRAAKAAAPRKRENTKTERIIALLKRPSGATLTEIMEETNWQSHSVRAFVCQLPRRFGLRIKSQKQNGERVYRIR